jgi:hypothetical protein
MKFAARSLYVFADVGTKLAHAHNPQGSDRRHGRSVFPLTGGGLSDNVCFRSTGPRSNLSAVEASRMSRFVCFFSLFFLAGSLILLSSSSAAQNVTTWHNDYNRTGLQQNETTLTPGSVGATAAFGLLWQYMGTQQNPMGPVYAQPLALSGLPAMTGCSAPCSLVFIADEFDNIWAFNAASNTLAWTVNLAMEANGTAVYCPSLPITLTFAPCETGVLGRNIGITGTPVIDANADILYAVAPIYDDMHQIIYYDLFAVNILNQSVASVEMNGSIEIPGQNPGSSSKCSSTYPNSGTLPFNANHIQRSALLLLNGSVYVAFAPSDSEWENGWIIGYSYTASGGFVPGPVFSPTPYGTGGGIWASGAGPASDGNYIYVTTGNGTWDVIYTHPDDKDFADSVLKLNSVPTNGVLPIVDYFTPSNVLSFSGSMGTGLCVNDEDVGSGGILIFPDAFYDGMNLMVSADKQSNLYFENVANLGQFNVGGGNNVETYLTPNSANNTKYPQPGQGYWASPAYWKYLDTQGTPHYLLYYAVTSESTQNCQYCGNLPYPIYQYALATSPSTPGPISNSVNSAAIPTHINNQLSEPSLFCIFSPTPSVSSFGTSAGSGILWAVESQNPNNSPGAPAPNCAGTPKGPAALHAYDATSMNQLYTSSGVTAFTIGLQPAFSTPTVFQGRVYMGTGTEVDVFGLCTEGPNGVCPPQ